MHSRIDLILTDRRCYTFEAYASCSVSRCFENWGMDYKVIYLSDGSLQDYFFFIQETPPRWTLGFANLTPHHKPLCDVINIPHFYWLEGTFAHAVHFLHSTFGMVGVSDYHLCQKLASHNIKYLPHGVECFSSEEKRVLDVTFFADLIDLCYLEKMWKDLFVKEEIVAIKKGIETGNPLEEKLYFFYIEQYLKAKKTEEIVQNFKKVPLHIFGEHAGNNWLVRLPKNVHLHTQLPFSEHFEVLKLSKMIIADLHSPWYFPAIATGCLPVLPDENEIQYLLDHPDERERRIEGLQKQVQSRSWEKQTEQLTKLMHRESERHYTNSR